MGLKEWLSKPDPHYVDPNDLIAMVQGVRKPVTAYSVLRKQIAAAIQQGARLRADDPVAGAANEAAKQIALTTSYNEDTAKQLVRGKLEELTAEQRGRLATGTGVEEAGDAVAAAVLAGITPVDFSVDLSEPHMLAEPWRALFSGLMFLPLLAVIGLTGAVAFQENPSPGFFAAMTVIGFLAVVALLVLVMGYGKVKLTVKAGEAKGDEGNGNGENGEGEKPKPGARSSR